MPSGAGHDAQWLARKLPAAMMFVPSISGISHHWSENTSDEDLVLGAQVFTDGIAEALKELSFRNSFTTRSATFLPLLGVKELSSCRASSMDRAFEAARKLESRALAAITMKRLGLRYISTDELTIRRKRDRRRASRSCRRAAARSAMS